MATVPNDTVAVKRWGESVRPLLVEAFDVLGAQLKEIVKKRQDHKSVKLQGASVDGSLSGIIRKVFPEDSYGFIVTDDKLDVFFHANSLKDISMQDLAEGDAVSFAMEDGDKGPQATWVKTGSA